ncbi:MAG: HNH endonuclease [Solirubrobacteraceae bacterium]
MTLRACLTCGAPSPNRRCPTHEHIDRAQARGTRGTRGNWRNVRQRIIRRDGLTCQQCGRALTGRCDTHIDHIISVHHGGTNHPDNLRVLCRACNLTKGGR